MKQSFTRWQLLPDTGVIFALFCIKTTNYGWVNIEWIIRNERWNIFQSKSRADKNVNEKLQLNQQGQLKTTKFCLVFQRKRLSSLNFKKFNSTFSTFNIRLYVTALKYLIRASCDRVTDPCWSQLGPKRFLSAWSKCRQVQSTNRTSSTRTYSSPVGCCRPEVGKSSVATLWSARCLQELPTIALNRANSTESATVVRMRRKFQSLKSIVVVCKS